MRRIWRNFGVTSRRHKRPPGQRRHIVRMDNVMCQSRMRRLLLEQFFKNRSCPEPPGVGFVRRILRSSDRQRVEDLRFMVFGIFRGYFPHGLAVGEQARSLRRTLEVAVQVADSLEISPFTLRLCAHNLPAFRALPPCLQLAFVFRSRCERITPVAKRDSPVRNATRRTLPYHPVESSYAPAKLEEIHHRSSPLDSFLTP